MRAFVFLVLLFVTARARAVELRIEYGALERMLAEQVFTEEGRRYVKGNQRTRCNFAYLEKPRVRGDSGKLEVRARFTGRSALNMFGQCVGIGDAFDIIITAAPQVRSGNIGLADVKASGADRTSFYIRRVCAALSTSLSRDFRYPIAAEAKKALEDPGASPAYRRELQNFRIPEIRVAADALVLVVDFELTVK